MTVGDHITALSSSAWLNTDELDQDALLIRVLGGIAATRAEELWSAIEEALERACGRRVIVDLTRVTGFDNASIHELASTARDCARRRVDLHAVLKAHSPLEQHLRFAGVTHVLPVHHCLVGALPDCDDPDSSRGASRSCGT